MRSTIENGVGTRRRRAEAAKKCPRALEKDASAKKHVPKVPTPNKRKKATSSSSSKHQKGKEDQQVGPYDSLGPIEREEDIVPYVACWSAPSCYNLGEAARPRAVLLNGRHGRRGTRRPPS